MCTVWSHWAVPDSPGVWLEALLSYKKRKNVILLNLFLTQQNLNYICCKITLGQKECPENNNVFICYLIKERFCIIKKLESYTIYLCCCET